MLKKPFVKTIEKKSQHIEYTVKFGKRKTIQIKIEYPDKVTVLVPNNISRAQIETLVNQKSDWIFEKVEEFQKRSVDVPKRNFETGDIWLYLGKEYTLAVIEEVGLKKPMVYIEGEKLVVKMNSIEPKKVEEALEKWYREKAQEVILDRVSYYQKHFSKIPRSIRVKTQKKRWGSCTWRDDLLFNWRCVMARIESVDYIVVHEMCHMIEKNHSKAYWQLVESIYPSYKVEKLWLKQNSIMIN